MLTLRAELVNNTLIDIYEACINALRREVTLYVVTRRLAHLFGDLGIIRQIHQPVGQLLGRMFWHEESGLTMNHFFWYPRV
jgi:hypothetical protein